MVSIRFVGADACRRPLQMFFKAIPHNSKCRYGERGAADAKPKAQIILDAAKVSAASGGNSEPKQGQRSQSARGFCPRSTMRVPQPDIIEHFGNAVAVPQPPERCLSRQAGIVRCCLISTFPRYNSQPPHRGTFPQAGRLAAFIFCLFMGSVRGGSARAGFVWALARPGAWKHSTALSAHPPQRKAEPDHSNHPAGRG